MLLVIQGLVVDLKCPRPQVTRPAVTVPRSETVVLEKYLIESERESLAPVYGVTL